MAYIKDFDPHSIKHELLNSMVEKLYSISKPPSDSSSIYRVPRFVRQLKEEAYTPRLVSIGPFHHGHENLQTMEVHKIRYTQSLFQRTPNPDLALSECVEAILSIQERARQCYSGLDFDHHQTTLGLAQILLVDGCFILEVLLRWTNSYDDDFINRGDPVFGNVSMINCLRRDLLLLENQIPFFVLDSLFKIIKGIKGIERISNWEYLSLQQLCVSFHLPLNLNTQPMQEMESNGARHLLDMVHNYYLPSYHKKTPQSTYMTFESIHCATKLEERGIKFKKGSSEHLFDIKFRNGVLEIPLLLIQDATESLLRNMIAFEECCPGTSQYITSYVMLMDRLIDTPRDVELLQQRRIIVNNLGSREDVSQLFNNMFKEVALQDFYFEDLCQEINMYSNRRWPTYRANLRRNYFSNPWSILLVLALFMLLTLTMVQTIFAVLSYYPR